MMEEDEEKKIVRWDEREKRKAEAFCDNNIDL